MNMQRIAGQAELFFKRNGPAILTAAGVGGIVASNILSVRAARKADKKIEAFKQHVEYAKAHHEQSEDKKLIARSLLEDGWEIAREFAPAIGVASVSIVCIVTAHRISQKRQASLVAAYAALDTAFRSYRQRVRDELGDEKELELYRRKSIGDWQEGDMPITPCEVDQGSVYGRFFDATNPNWTKTPEYNLMFLTTQQNWANNRLQARGYLYLNEVYDALGMEWSQSGQVVGWKLKKNGQNDGYVDFGIHNIGDEISRAFVNGLEDSIFLDFNVDGPIGI